MKPRPAKQDLPAKSAKVPPKRLPRKELLPPPRDKLFDALRGELGL